MNAGKSRADSSAIGETEGSSQVDVRQKRERPARPPQVRCGVCSKELDELKAMKSETQEDVTFFCDLQCFGEWERERSDR
ncbi:hypothetical protein BH24PSE2_BH24PSE2_17620 [soil metagenome]